MYQGAEGEEEADLEADPEAGAGEPVAPSIMKRPPGSTIRPMAGPTREHVPV